MPCTISVMFSFPLSSSPESTSHPLSIVSNGACKLATTATSTMVTLQDQKMTSSARPLMGEGSRSHLTLGGGKIEDGSNENSSTVSMGHKLGWIVSALFIVADMVGGGVVAMPVAFVQSGLFFGVVFMVGIAIIFMYTGYQLGVVWNIMQERWPQYHDHCRKPFPEIARRSMGPAAKKFTSILVNVTLFGICVVYLLLSANIAYFFVSNFLPSAYQLSYCQTIVVLAVILSPFTYLKSPADFWPVIVAAMATTTLAVVAIMAGVFRDMPKCGAVARLPNNEPTVIIQSVGVFLFAFSGHYVFPTIQHDMREPKKFTRSVTLGFFLVVVLYMPLSALSFLTYGDSLHQSVVYSVQTYPLQLFANLMIAVHCILTLVIVINPVNQEVEEFFKIAHHFGRGRFTVRTIVLLLVIFVALTVPDFSPVMNVVGASTIPLGCAVLPSLFYVYINAAEEYEWQKNQIPSFMDVMRRTKKTTLVLNLAIILLAVIGGGYSTYLGIDALKGAAFQAPCYLQPFLESNVTIDLNASGHGFAQACCGPFRNVSTFLETCGSDH